jgi:hypothetical protein
MDEPRPGNARLRHCTATAHLTPTTCDYRACQPLRPSTAIIDRHGKAAVRILGAVTEPALTMQLDALLAEP